MPSRRISASAGLILVAMCGALFYWQSRPPHWPREFDEHVVFPGPGDAAEAGVVRRPEVRQPPEGEVVRCRVVRDAWFSNVGKESLGNLGGAEKLKLKSYQEFSLVDIDPKPLRGRVVRAATLNLRLISPEILKRVSVGTVAAEWVEGSSARYRPQTGSSSFQWRVAPDAPWSFVGSDLSSVILGNGNTLWWMADATVPDASGWQRVAVEPAVVAARSAGLSHGFVLYDDQGLEWTLEGDRLKKQLPANRFVASREAGDDSAPWLEVVLGEPDDRPPQNCDRFELDPETSRLPAGEALIRWLTPRDDGGAGVCGFLVELNGTPLPRYLIPPAGAAGEAVELHCRDVALNAGDRHTLTVRAVDGAGNIGPSASFEFTPSTREPVPLPELETFEPSPRGDLPELDGARIAVVDTLDKVHPVSGEFIPAQPVDYLRTNPQWNAARREITLQAARNEIVGFQILIAGAIDAVSPKLSWDDPGPAADFFEAGLVKSKSGLLPDPLLPFEGRFRNWSDGASNVVPVFRSVWCELVVPHRFAPGVHRGALRLQGPKSSLELTVRLEVWPFELPDRLSFIPEMNCYHLPENEYEYYRLAHRHRTVLNRLPYSQSGRIDDGCAPEVTDSGFNWRRYDARFGPLLDGSAFRGLPRQGVPLETFYLPIHENWPTPIEGQYNGSYWADLAFRNDYRNRFRDAVADFARHIAERGWNGTQFQVYLNNKIHYKKPSWRHGSSPWLLDEPASTHDFWAVGWFGRAFHEGLAATRIDRSPLVFRVDVSRPQWQRDMLDEVLDYNVCASAAGRSYRRLLLDNQRRFGQQIVDYGTSNPIEGGNLQPAGWCLDAWCRGADGVLPWQTLGQTASWERADQLALFYPSPRGGRHPPLPSLRLKSYLRGQQDVEYLTLLQNLTQEPRWAIGQQVVEALGLRPEARGTGHVGDEDAGLLTYDSLRPQQLWALRIAVARRLSERAEALVATPRPLVPERKSRRARGGYVTVGVVPWEQEPPKSGGSRN